MTDEEVKTEQLFEGVEIERMQSSAAEENATVNENSAENVAKAPAAEKQNIAKEYANFESDVDYTTVLDDFEGPLDLLLHLINIAKNQHRGRFRIPGDRAVP